MGACARGRLWDAALCLTAAFTGLRVGELLALVWRDVDYGGEAIRVRRSYNVHGGVGSPTSGKVRAVPMVPDVAERLARLAGRGFWVDPEDLVFARGDEAKLLVEAFRPAGTFGEVSAETSWNVPLRFEPVVSRPLRVAGFEMDVRAARLSAHRCVQSLPC